VIAVSTELGGLQAALREHQADQQLIDNAVCAH
jgi:hypothetical protein